MLFKTVEAHSWPRTENDWYIDPAWCSERLFEEERFVGAVHDPCCGFGTIPEAAIRAGFAATGADIVDRGYAGGGVEDFFASTERRDNIVCNPPFNIVPAFTRHALGLSAGKTAIIFATARLNAAHWLRGLPLRRVWLLTPRPSMPPGRCITAGEKPGGGRHDFSWLVFQRGFNGPPEMVWLHRDRKQG